MKKIILKILYITSLFVCAGSADGMTKISDLNTKLSDDHIEETLKQALLKTGNGVRHAWRLYIHTSEKICKAAVAGVDAIVALPGKTVRQAITLTKQNPKKSIALGAFGAFLFAQTIFPRNAARAAKQFLTYVLMHSYNRRLIAWALRSGANINRRHINRGNKTMLHLACEDGKADIVDYLILNGANISFTDRAGLKPIHYAAAHGHIEVVKRLVRAGEDINAITTDGERYSPLHIAAKNLQLPMVRWLVQHGANNLQLDELGSTPRQLLAETRYPEILCPSYHPADIMNYLDQLTHAPADNWFTQTLHSAITDHDAQRARGAINSGASLVDTINPDNTPLIRTIDAYNPRQATPLDEIAGALVTAGSPLRITDTARNTPLHLAATHNNTRLAQLFLDHGADVRAMNGHNETPLEIALRSHNRSIINLLREHGAFLTAEQLAANPWLVEAPADPVVVPVATH